MKPTHPRCQARRWRRQSGFSLIELMVAILILFIGIVSVAELVPAAMKSNFRNRNDSTALIVAQRQLTQMAEQAMTVEDLGDCAAGVAGHFYFCDQDGDIVALGSNGTTVLSDGCPLNANGDLDFTADCPDGYSVTKTWVWNPVANIEHRIELRWHIVSKRNGTVPVRKVIVIGARAGTAAQGFMVTNLQTVVGTK
jgi:prepilin-type N-terminal cleavage/methylation domain-containing protein